MLRFRFGVTQGESCASFRAALTNELGAFAFRFDGVVVSNRELPLRPAVVAPWHILLRVEKGALARSGETLGVGSTLLLSDRWLLPSATVDLDLRTSAPSVSLVAMRIPSAAVIAPDLVSILDANEDWSALVAIGRALHDGTGTDDELDAALRETWARLVTLGHVRGAAPGKPDATFDRAVERVAAALSVALSQLERNPQMIDLLDEAGVTERQLLRDLVDVQARFGIVKRGWRDTLNYWRLASATMFLGVEHLSVSEVAKAVGFANTTTMARAFRNAGLSQPTVVRARQLSFRAR